MLSDLTNDDAAIPAGKGRCNVLMADGHVSNMSAAELNTAAQLRMTYPKSSVPNS